MAKGDRKRNNKGKKKVEVKTDARPLVKMEANMFQQLVQISNQYAKLRKQFEEYTTVVEKLKERRKKVQKGEIKLPILLPLGRNQFYQEDDKKVILEKLDDEIKIISNALKGVSGQMGQHKDAYIEAGLQVLDFIDRRFGKCKPKNVYSKGCNPKKKEKVLFEGELDELLKDKDKQKEFKKAKAKAVKKNKEQAKKKEE